MRSDAVDRQWEEAWVRSGAGSAVGGCGGFFAAVAVGGFFLGRMMEDEFCRQKRTQHARRLTWKTVVFRVQTDVVQVFPPHAELEMDWMDLLGE